MRLVHGLESKLSFGASLLYGLQHTNDHGRHSARLQCFVHALGLGQGDLQ